MSETKRIIIIGGTGINETLNREQIRQALADGKIAIISAGTPLMPEDVKPKPIPRLMDMVNIPDFMEERHKQMQKEAWKRERRYRKWR